MEEKEKTYKLNSPQPWINSNEAWKKMNEDNYQTSAGYDSYDDIENQHFINISKLSASDSSEKINDTKFSKQKISKIDKNNYLKNLSLYRIMNALSIFLLLITFFSVSFTKINDSNYLLIADHLGNSNIHSESNKLILNVAFSIVSSKIQKIKKFTININFLQLNCMSFKKKVIYEFLDLLNAFCVFICISYSIYLLSVLNFN